METFLGSYWRGESSIFFFCFLQALSVSSADILQNCGLGLTLRIRDIRVCLYLFACALLFKLLYMFERVCVCVNVCVCK